ncbi:hypothetical protein ACIPL1_22640 [Pseudomonas sp. NPDC090202]|uniref:hypothetical protein n=1 Tax=unclassified Pseudomonas TaxID=196821 RepID=UPI0037FE5E06
MSAQWVSIVDSSFVEILFKHTVFAETGKRKRCYDKRSDVRAFIPVRPTTASGKNRAVIEYRPQRSGSYPVSIERMFLSLRGNSMKSLIAFVVTLLLVAISATALAMPCSAKTRSTGEAMDAQQMIRLHVAQQGPVTLKRTGPPIRLQA